MKTTYPITRPSCQFCTGKTHCAQCAAEVEEKLLHSPGVDFAAVDLRQNLLHIGGDDEDRLLDAIDDAGLLIG